MPELKKYLKDNNTESFTQKKESFSIDWVLVCSLMILMAVGLTMVASASIPKAINLGIPYLFFKKQVIFALFGIFVGVVVFFIPINFWYKYSYLLLFIAFVSLILVLIPGIGKSINGARRWIPLPGFNVQVSEVVRLLIIIYTASFLTRNQNQIRSSFSGMLRLMFVLGFICLLLLMQPDFGAVVVYSITVLGMLFLAGVCLVRFFTGAFIVSIILFGAVFLESYRVKRLMHFREPFENMYNEGYQLAQSLIAIGRGELFGVGLGESIQKYYYLPEAHTDFIFSIFAEEMGLIGIICLIILYLTIVWKAFMIAGVADRVRMRFGSCIAYGIGIWLAIQFLINISVSTGIAPTKGLTLPLISYGGSSLVMTIVMFSILLRISSEAKILQNRQKIAKIIAKNTIKDEEVADFNNIIRI